MSIKKRLWPASCFAAHAGSPPHPTRQRTPAGITVAHNKGADRLMRQPPDQVNVLKKCLPSGSSPEAHDHLLGTLLGTGSAAGAF